MRPRPIALPYETLQLWCHALQRPETVPSLHHMRFGGSSSDAGVNSPTTTNFRLRELNHRDQPSLFLASLDLFPFRTKLLQDADPSPFFASPAASLQQIGRLPPWLIVPSLLSLQLISSGAVSPSTAARPSRPENLSRCADTRLWASSFFRRCPPLLYLAAAKIYPSSTGRQKRQPTPSSRWRLAMVVMEAGMAAEVRMEVAATMAVSP